MKIYIVQDKNLRIARVFRSFAKARLFVRVQRTWHNEQLLISEWKVE